MESRTHLKISSELVGEPVAISNGKATVRLETMESMRADDHQLVHGGFTFGLADYAAMLAVNDPNVVLGSAECRFLAPVTVGEVLTAEAKVEHEEGKKRKVSCVVSTDKPVFEASFTCFVLGKHILDQ